MKHLLLIFLFIGYSLFPQSPPVKATLLDKTTAIRFSMFETGLNQPGGPDTTRSIIELKKQGGNYTFQYVEISPKLVELYNSKTLKAFEFSFTINEKNEIVVLADRTKLMNILKKDLVDKFGKDTAAFGDYFFMMYTPNQMIEDKYVKYIKILKPYMDIEIKNEKEELFIPCMTGPIPANYTNTFSTTKDVIEISSVIKTDSVRVRSYLYADMIKKSGESVKDVLKEKDMVYVPTTITTIAKGENKNAVCVIKQIDYEHRHNQGNEFDIVEIIKIKRVN